ncbi:MAG: hypothetical protein ABII88_00500 [Candidatus Omnitrophota bacterium]
MKKKSINKSLFLLSFAAFFLLFTSPNCFSEESEGSFSLCPWKVGQSVEYQIMGYDDSGRENSYRLAIVGKEIVDNKDFFWIRFDIFSFQSRKISFMALVPPYDRADFSEHYNLYIREGLFFLLKRAEKIMVILDDDSCYELSASEISQEIPFLNDSFYNTLPGINNEVDYSKLKIFDKKEKVATPEGEFYCYRFSSQTNKYESASKEGMDLWRSPDVPFLGIVKMEFSKTKNIAKIDQVFQCESSEGSWLRKLYLRFFLKKVPRERIFEDTFFMQLIDYQREERLIADE